MPSPEMLTLILGPGGVIVVLLIVWFRAEQRADSERAKNEVLARESIQQSAKTEATLDRIASILAGRKSGA